MKQARARDIHDWDVSVSENGKTAVIRIKAASSWGACVNAAFDRGVRSSDLIAIPTPYRCSAKTRGGVFPALDIVSVRARD